MFDPGTFGKTPLIPFVGMIVGFASQRKQISGLGWGWRYKVRIIGDYSEKDTIKEQDIRYAIVMLPTTAGSGGGGRLTPVRIAQGDMVFGFYANGDDGLPIITGVFPRTRFHALKDISDDLKGVWDKITGWFGTIQPGVLGRQEINEQGGATTPNLRTGGKTGRTGGNQNLRKMGIDPAGESKIGDIKKPQAMLNDEPFIPTHPGKDTASLNPTESNWETYYLARAEKNLTNGLNDPNSDKAKVLAEYKAAVNSSASTAEEAYNEALENKSTLDAQIEAAGVQAELNQNRAVEGNVTYTDGFGVQRVGSKEDAALYGQGGSGLSPDIESRDVTEDSNGNKTTVTKYKDGKVSEDIQYVNGEFKEVVTDPNGDVSTFEFEFE